MKNLPNSASESEIESWRQWAKQSNSTKKVKFSGLRESAPTQIRLPGFPQPPRYTGCSSCRRWK